LFATNVHRRDNTSLNQEKLVRRLVVDGFNGAHYASPQPCAVAAGRNGTPSETLVI
jgi:hypothetical protein